MPMTWDAENDRKLFLAVLETQDVKVDLDAIATKLSTPATVCTPLAVSKRLQKLKAMAKAEGSTSDGNTSGETKTPTSGRGKKRAKAEDDDENGTPTKKGRKAGGGKGKAKAMEEDAPDEDEAGGASPVKDEPVEQEN